MNILDYKNKRAFTLTELIVVMTLLVILGTIAYLAIDGNLAEARDAGRNNDITQMVNVLELYQTDQGEFPTPDNAVNVVYSGSAIAWTQGTFGTTVGNKVKSFGVDIPTDPLFKNEFSYSITNNGREFQLGAIHETSTEEEGLGELTQSLIAPNTYAGKIETAFVKGDYNEVMVKARDNGVEYFLASPSIISSDLSNPDFLDIIQNRKLVYNNFFNLPENYKDYLDVNGGFDFNVSDPLIFSGSLSVLQSEDILLDFYSKLKYVYATTPTESFDTYLSLLEKEGLTSLKGFLTRKFKISFRSYFNCKDILDAGASEGDRLYLIDPDGDGPVESYEVYCDMTTDGGGWTRVGDNHIINGDFSSGNGIVDAYEYADNSNEIVALTSPVDENTFALHQTGNYSSYYGIGFTDPSVLKPGYEVRMSLWRSDYGSGVVDTGSTSTKILAGKNNNYTLGTCTSGSTCYFKDFNSKMANASNFGPGGTLTEIPITVTSATSTITTPYLDGGILFDGFIPSLDYSASNSYSSSELKAIDDWVLAGGFLLSTNDDSRFDPIGEYYDMPSGKIWENVSQTWEIQNIDHPLVNGSIGLGVDLRGKTLIGEQNYSALIGTVLPDDIVLARDKYAPYLPTVILRKHGKGNILFTADEGIFRNMSPGTTFLAADNEDAFAAAIMTYSIETSAGINPHEGYVFHNRIYYNDGTFSTNGEDQILETITIDDNGTPRIWSYEQTRHKIYKVPENFEWQIGLDANNNKDLYFTGVRLELFYR